MEDLRTIFSSKIKNIPFVECVDKNQFYDEFLNSPKETINEELILSEILKGKDASEIEKIIGNWYKRDDSNIDDIINGILKKREVNIEFNTKLLEVIKTKNKNYYIPDITRTQTYQTITKINEVYTDFLYLISEKKKYQIVEGKDLNEISESKIIYDKFLDPKIKAERILQILEYFNDDIQHRIIQKIINDDSYLLYSVTEKNNPNFQQTKDALENFRKYLHELDKKSNPKATQKQTIQEEIDNYIPNIPQKENLAQDKLDGYTFEEIEFINDYLEEYKTKGEIDDNNYNLLVKAFLSFINYKIFPEEKIKFKRKVDQKKLGTSIRKLLERKDLFVDDRVLRFAKNYISIYENTTYHEGIKGRENLLYRYFHENRY